MLESAPINESELAEYCRKRDVFSEQVAQWKEACMGANAPSARKPKQRSQHEARTDKKKIKELTEELNRKEKALAETAALLVLTPHPSGANAERIAYFLKEKSADKLSVKTNAHKIDEARAKAIATVERM